MNRNAFFSTDTLKKLEVIAYEKEQETSALKRKQLREQAAIAALNGLLANSSNTPENTCYALVAVQRADQLLYALGYKDE